MFEFLKTVNKKNLKEDPSLQRNQPKKGIIKIDDEIEIDGSGSISNKEINISIIERF